MHGELLSALCAGLRDPLAVARPTSVGGPECPQLRGAALRPDVVWFGEVPYEMDRIFDALGELRPLRLDRHVRRRLPGGRVRPRRPRVRRPHPGAQPLPSEGSLFFHESRQGPAGELVPAWVDDLLT